MSYGIRIQRYEAGSPRADWSYLYEDENTAKAALREWPATARREKREWKAWWMNQITNTQIQTNRRFSGWEVIPTFGPVFNDFGEEAP